MNNLVFGKTMERVREHWVIKLLTTENRRKKTIWYLNHIIIQQNYFSKNVIAIEIKKIQMFMNKPVYLGLSILELCKTVKYEFCYDYVKPKYIEKAKLCYEGGETFCSLLVTFSLLLVTFCSLLVTFCSLLVTFYSLLVTFYSLLDKKF